MSSLIMSYYDADDRCVTFSFEHEAFLQARGDTMRWVFPEPFQTLVSLNWFINFYCRPIVDDEPEMVEVPF